MKKLVPPWTAVKQIVVKACLALALRDFNQRAVETRKRCIYTHRFRLKFSGWCRDGRSQCLSRTSIGALRWRFPQAILRVTLLMFWF